MRSTIRLLLSILILASPCWSEEPKVYPEAGVQTFLGLDDTSAPTQVQDGRAQDLQNVKLDVSKSLRQRYGYSLVGATLDQIEEDECAVTGLYYTKFSSLGDQIVATCGTHWFYLNGSSWTVVSGITVSQTDGQDNQFVFTTALDTIIATNNVNRPIQYTGTTLGLVDFSSLTSTSRPTTAKTVAFFKNYLVFCNVTEGGIAYPTRCRWSNPGTISTWSDADFVDVSDLGGQAINAVAELYDNLYIFLTDSIYRVSFVAGADTFQISKVSSDIGCIAKNSVQVITLKDGGNGLVFLDKDKKIYFFNGITPQDITPLITQTMGALSASRLPYAVSADSTTDYYLCVTNGSGGVNNLCLDLQYQIGEWTKYTNVPANAMAHVLDPNSKDQVYVGTYEAFVYQLENTSLRDDVGSASGTVASVTSFQTSTVSGAQVLYVTGANYVTGQLVGAPIELTGGTGVGQVGVLAYNTATGLVVQDPFSTTPTSTTTFEVGAIDSFYTTKWYDLGQAARLKHFGEVYFWAQADATSTHTLAYATDFNADITSVDISLTSDANDSIWGSAVWGTSLWGSQSQVFRQVKLDSQGRYLRIKWQEDDPGQTFDVFGFNILARPGDVN